MFYGTKRLPTALTVIFAMAGMSIFSSRLAAALSRGRRSATVAGRLDQRHSHLRQCVTRQALSTWPSTWRSRPKQRSKPNRRRKRSSQHHARQIAGATSKREPQWIADKYDQVTLIFADVVNFTPRASRIATEVFVAFLNRIFSSLMRLPKQLGIEKIETIGDAYMVAGGLTEARPDQVVEAANLALDMLEVVSALSHELGEDVSVVGIHTGPAVAGVLGKPNLLRRLGRMLEHGSPHGIPWITGPQSRSVRRGCAQAAGRSLRMKSRGLVISKARGRCQVCLPEFALTRDAPRQT